MIAILAVLPATRASPLGIPPPPLVSGDQLQAPSCSDPDGCRSLWDIIRSCGLTMLLCIWASVHTNIPSPDERWPKIAVRRAGIVLAALFMPELIIAWALRQRMAAVRLAEEHKGEYIKTEGETNSDHSTQKRDGRSLTDSLRLWVVSPNTMETDPSECCCPNSYNPIL